MKKVPRLDYAYAVGRVRALEKSLISRAVFWEAAEEKDFSSALKVIFDAGTFLEEKVDLRNAVELDKVLEKEEEALHHLVSGLLLEEAVLRVLEMEEAPDKALPIAESTGYDFFIGYLRRRIDLRNLKVFLRAKYSDIPEREFVLLLRRGGEVDTNKYAAHYGLSLSEFREHLRATDYFDIWNRAVDALLERETFVDLERGIEDYLMRFLQRAKCIVFGPEPVFAYALARRRELRLVRLLGVGKINRIPEDILKSRISETYV
jgi:V/A-type H+-transporting ATPase subunit C